MHEEQLNAPKQHYERLALHPVAGSYSLASEDHPHRNEDAHYEGAYTFIVADGMGGEASGEVASAQVVKSMSNYLDVARWRTTDEDVANAIKGAGAQTYADIVKADPNKRGIGSVVVGARFYDVPAHTLPNGRQQPEQTHVTVFNVGDTRAYLDSPKRDDMFLPLTLDNEGKTHTKEVQAVMADATKTTDLGSFVGQFARRNQAVGYHSYEKEPALEMHSLRMFPGDRLLLCTDGIHDLLTDPELLDLMTMAETGQLPKDSTIRELLKHDQSVDGDGQFTAAVAELFAGLGNPALGAKVIVHAAHARTLQEDHMRVRGAQGMGGKRADDMTATIIKTAKTA